MTEHVRIEELRRRVQQDQSSIAFAQLAEALRRDGQVQDAIDTCRAGLSFHPDYLSARVTLGRALIEAGDLDTAEVELTHVLSAAPENLAAVKGLADIHQRRGEPREARDLYRRALELAPHDADIELAVSRLGTDVEPSARPFEAGTGGSPGEAAQAPIVIDVGLPAVPEGSEPAVVSASLAIEDGLSPAPSVSAPAVVTALPVTAGDAPEDVHPPAQVASLQAETLERWLDAILADRARQG